MCTGMSEQYPLHWIVCPFPTVTTKEGMASIGRWRNSATRSWRMLWELSVSMRIVTKISWIRPLTRRVRVEDGPLSAAVDNWKCAASGMGSGDSEKSSIVQDSGESGVGSDVSDAGGSSARRRRNCFLVQKWSGWYLSSQLKQSPRLRRSCISGVVTRRIGKGDDGEGKIGGLGVGGVIGGGGKSYWKRVVGRTSWNFA